MKSVEENKEKRPYTPIWYTNNIVNEPAIGLALIENVRAGVKKSEWKDFIHGIGATEKEFESILPSSISSMQKKAVYDKETSERIYELARLYGLGYSVFDEKSDFDAWLDTPCTPLGDKRPFELLDSSFGFELVRNQIVRIQYNVYS